MVKKLYVITVGVDPGVYFADWVEVAPLVKNHPSSIYQCAESEAEALRLFENARLRGQIRDLSPLSGSTASPRPPTASVRVSSNSSPSNTPHRRRSSTPKLTMSRSEAPMRNGVSPTRLNFGDSNTGSTAGKATTSLNRMITISKSHSEPNPSMSASNSLKKVFERGYPASDGTESVPCVGAASTRIRTRAESPSWLASYPGDESSQSISPTLSPTASPAISSRSFESHRPVPFSTPSNFHDDGETVEHIDAGSSETARLPVPSFRQQEVREGSSSGVNQATESKNAALKRSSKNSRHGEAALQQQSDIEPFVQIVVDEVLRRLRPSARVEDEPLPDSRSERPSKSKGHNRNTENQGKRSDVLSPGSLSQRNRSPPASGAKDLLSPGVPNGSVLFGRSQDNLGPLVRNSPLKRNEPCQHCNGTGYDARVDASVLDETGLNQSNFAPFHTYDSVQDPRSPFTGLKKLASPFTFRRPSAIVSSKLSAKTSC